MTKPKSEVVDVLEEIEATLGANTGLPASLGQKTMAASTSVAIASDQPALAISQPGLSGGIVQSVTTVGATAVPVPTTPLAGRAGMIVQNVGGTTIYLGAASVTADTAATGGVMLMPGGQSLPVSIAAAVILYAISSAAGGKVACLEIGA